ncbi:hypothetical protein OUZ56_013880 [Daphnia magna]|uniref:Uncharacterized protein n=1 Tax=Daphnia magna TaxID=35525 RepID=A0ABQ9Z779_9CRUS|nr:hypothetical protein OUZ56_013880 [Daphnia magna]
MMVIRIFPSGLENEIYGINLCVCVSDSTTKLSLLCCWLGRAVVVPASRCLPMQLSNLRAIPEIVCTISQTRRKFPDGGSADKNENPNDNIGEQQKRVGNVNNERIQAHADRECNIRNRAICSVIVK